MRTSTISAAASGRPAAATSVIPLSSICQVRESTRMESFSAKPRPRMRSTSISAGSSATAGTIFTRVTKCVNSARSVEHDRGIGADVVLVAQLGERRGHIAAHQRLEQVDHPRAVGQPQHLPHVLRAHRPGRVRDRLIEQRERVAHRAFRGARDQGKRLGLDLDRFLARRSPARCFTSSAGIDPAQVEALAARQDGDRDLADLGGGEDELGVRRRLLQRLEQRVERLRGQHVDFVEDVDLVARADRRIADGVVDLAHVVDAVVGGGVHLDDVDVPALHDRLAVRADRSAS